MTIEQLNSDYGLSQQLTFGEGPGGFPLVEVNNGLAKATISLYGGQILAFQPAAAAPVLFLSPCAYYAPGKAIKGGAPVCWPWFGPDPEGKGRPAHGFVRNRLWRVIRTETLTSGETQVVLGLNDSEETRAIWNHGFELAIAFTIGTRLQIELTTRNTGDTAFTITQALHTYFAIGDIGQVGIQGLDGTQYLDKVDSGAEKAQTGTLDIAQEVDRIYLDVPPSLVIDDAALGRCIKIDSVGSKTAVVWNPWAAISASSGDLEDGAYQQFVCVETVNAANEVVEVAAGADYKLGATYSIT
ncbi:MAG: D-hexose-6-phosphate mutarotase [Synechococcales cyanobacterium RM1_1_8]|nr:D-hexose-6-phosphate mutarotase [Synechococcales cyanobacterium RM1_1_8]